MKIEICEQMVQSWLQHIKKCQVVQTNWMISPLRMPKNHPSLPYVKWFMEDIAKKLNDAIDAETRASFALSNACDIVENHTQDCSEELEGSSVELLDRMMSSFMALNKTVDCRHICRIFPRKRIERFHKAQFFFVFFQLFSAFLQTVRHALTGHVFLLRNFPYTVHICRHT